MENKSWFFFSSTYPFDDEIVKKLSGYSQELFSEPVYEEEDGELKQELDILDLTRRVASLEHWTKDVAPKLIVEAYENGYKEGKKKKSQGKAG